MSNMNSVQIYYLAVSCHEIEECTLVCLRCNIVSGRRSDEYADLIDRRECTTAAFLFPVRQQNLALVWTKYQYHSNLMRLLSRL